MKNPRRTERVKAGEPDDESLAENVAARYGDIERLKPKKTDDKRLAGGKPIARGTPSVTESLHCGGMGLQREIHVAEVVYPEELRAAEAEQPRYTKVKVALDSGAGAHVINRGAVPRHQVVPSQMSEQGAAFLAADGGRIKNHGEVRLSLLARDSGGNCHKITSKFEAADVTRALWSVGLICDSGLHVNFASEKATISDQDGKELCVFLRTNGLYVAEVDVENPGVQRRGA